MARRGFGAAVAAAWAGTQYAWRSQPHVRFEVAAAIAATSAAVWLGTGLVAVLLASALVLATEFVNTAVEALVDLLAPEQRPRAGVAKDVAAGAVLVSAGFAVAVGVAALGPALWTRLQLGGPG